MRKIFTFISTALLCLSISACGFTPDTEKAASITYTYKSQTISVKAAPNRIVELSAPLLNMAYAAGGTSIARPDTSSPIPDAAASLPTLGHVQNINMETLIGLKPDLALGERNQNGKLESLLKSNGIPYLLVQYDGINDNIPLLRFMGQIYNKEDKAEEVIRTYENSMKEILTKIEGHTPAKVAVLRATGKDVTAETSKSICASMVEMLKMQNVVTSHEKINISSKTVPYSLEQLSSDDPDIIFIVTMGKQKEINKKLDETMRSNPAWSHLKAVKAGKVYFLDPELYLMNPGVHTPEAMNKLYQLAYENSQ